MKLSIGIPTYNRCDYLKKNLNILANQIRDCNLLSEVEINISNNGSNDNTDSTIKEFCLHNPDIKTHYHRFEENAGPDANYIATMIMAKGNYSILLGDDDFLVENGLKTIICLIDTYKDVDIFLSNRTEITGSGKFICNRSFLHKDIKSRVFDFSDDNQAGFYFSLCNEVGGCLTFISSIIYKTGIINEIGEYNHCLDGTFYSFWYYLWGKLSKGGKLYYYEGSYILNTQEFNNNFGSGLSRTLVEFEGFKKAADIFFDNKSYKKCFLDIPKRWKNLSSLSHECFFEKNIYENQLLPLLESGNNEGYLEDVVLMQSWKYHLRCFFRLYFPKRIWIRFSSLIVNP